MNSVAAGTAMNESILQRAPQILEQNEDIIAACLENLQLGRLDECVKHYSLLQSNLISLALEVDNYPIDGEDPRETLKEFPDQIMRKDVLDDLRSSTQLETPQSPLQPPCSMCAVARISAEKCRLEFKHTDPSSRFTPTESSEFLSVTHILEMRQRQMGHELKAKRNYRRWSAEERHTALTVLSLFGNKNQGKIVEFLEDRNENQVRSFINKAFDPDFVISISNGAELPPPPPGYVPPPKLLQELRRRAMANGEKARDNFGIDLGPPHGAQMRGAGIGEPNLVLTAAVSSYNMADGSAPSLLSSVDTTNTTNDLFYVPSSSSGRLPTLNQSGFPRCDRTDSDFGADYSSEIISSVTPVQGKDWGALMAIAAAKAASSREQEDEYEIEEVNDFSDARHGLDYINNGPVSANASSAVSRSSGHFQVPLKTPQISSLGRLQDKYGTMNSSTSKSATSTSSSSGSEKKPTGLAAAATIKILSDTIKILSTSQQQNKEGSIKASASQSVGFSINKKSKVANGTEPKKLKISQEKASKEPKQKGESKLAKKRDAKILKEKLKIVSNGRGKSKFNNLFKLPEKHSSWSGNNEIFCEDSNSGLLDHNLQLLDSEILQSPTKLGLFSEVIGTSSTIVSSISGRSTDRKVLLSPRSPPKRQKANGKQLFDSAPNSSKTSDSAREGSVISPFLSIGGDVGDATSEYSQFSIMGDNFSLLNGPEDFSISM